LAAAGNLDGDGLPDYFVGDPQASLGATQLAGVVYAMDGRTHAILYTIQSPAPQAGALFGFYISVIGDVNGDHVNDIAIGTDAQSVGSHPNQGEAWVFSGKTGQLLYALNNPNPQGSATHRARFGSRIGSAGDVNGDGIPDILVGASGNDGGTAGPGCSEVNPLPSGCRAGQGQAFIFSGKDGALLRTLDLPASDTVDNPTCASRCGNFGISVQSPGKFGGHPGELIDAGNFSVDTATGRACASPAPPTCKAGQGRMYLFDGTTGALIRKIDDPIPQAGAEFGFQDVTANAPGDVNHDGVPDIYGNGFTQDNPGPPGSGEGTAWVFDGATGKVLYTLTSPTPELGGQFGWSMTSTDYSHDGTLDLYVGSSPHHVAGASGSGGTWIFDGSNGSLLKTLPLPASDRQASTPTNLGPNLGWSIAAPGDLNGDGEPDYLGGAPFFDTAANQDEGRVYQFTSVVGPGRLVLQSRRLRVSHGRVHVPLQCKSSLPCNGTFSITTRVSGAVSRTSPTVVCTQSKATFFRIPPRAKKTVAVRARLTCLTLLRGAKHHTIKAKFTSRPRTGQLGIIKTVTLVLR
jgi:hypothetical protein